MKLRQFIAHYWPFLGLILVELCLISANYTHGTFLIGWDNVMPEFNFLENFKRSIWGVWQEHRGLGLYDGMSHIANLPHTIFLWTLSLLLPQNTLRYIFTFFMHFLGGVGTYAVLKKLLSKETHAKSIAFVGSLFYLLNPATIQMFYTPLEAFSVHFAALPWLALTLIRFIETSSRKALLWFALVLLLTTPQFFVTTLSLPVGLLLGVISLTYIRDSKRYWKSVAYAAITFLLINAFWLLPYVAGLPGNAPVIANAKINIMSTDEVFRRNQAFGDLKNVLFIHGFSLDFTDLTAGGTFGFMLAPWRIWWNTPLVTTLSGALILLMLIGLFASLRFRKTIAFAIIWLTTFVLLANNTPVVKEITTFLQRSIPFFTEAFRFPFTKFSLLFAFTYSVLIAYGLKAILNHLLDHKRLLNNFFTFGLGVCIIGQAIPAFRGNFLYPNVRLHIPAEYQQLFTRMATVDPSGRTAYLPQPDFWSWKQYRFGYRGSGFVWYGLAQPLMDRAFDPWSAFNENYYWELSRALYSKDARALAAVFSKYDIRYIILDENIISQSNDRALLTAETEDLLAHMPEMSSLNSFNKLKLYEYTGLASQSFVRLVGALPAVTPTYSWTDNDISYQAVGDYTNQQINALYHYPFRELFTKRTPTEKTFTVQESQNELAITDAGKTTTITIPKKDSIRYEATIHNDLQAKNITPCGLLKSGPAAGDVGNGEFLHLTSTDQRGCLSFGFPNLTHQEAYLVAINSRHINGRPLMLSLINQTAKHIETEIYLPGASEWTTSYLVLPPVTADGFGYTVYLANDAIGSQETVNDIASIVFYKIPYQEMIHMSSGSGTAGETVPEKDIRVTHPNSAYYQVDIKHQERTRTLILNQSYHRGWKAFYIQTSNSQLNNWFHLTFPFVFGSEIKEHVMVNNWANGWVLPAENFNDSSVVIFFMPQLFEWLGFILLPLPLLLPLFFHQIGEEK
ncbi:MAG: hypothetical protein NT149_03580 [Candidatus Gottesmanbacteria bacterium]|nr:hypothetical protein [Candidatus Gottesmanbacteria bacterium]